MDELRKVQDEDTRRMNIALGLEKPDVKDIQPNLTEDEIKEVIQIYY